jgi:hypothetical protein
MTGLVPVFLLVRAVRDKKPGVKGSTTKERQTEVCR